MTECAGIFQLILLKHLKVQNSNLIFFLNLDDALEMEPIDDLELPQEQDEQQIGAVSGGSESFKFKPITFGDEDEMRADVKSLSYEQRMSFDFVIEFLLWKFIEGPQREAKGCQRSEEGC